MREVKEQVSSVRMIDVSQKNDTHREAVAKAVVKMQPETAQMIRDGTLPKGDVLTTAQVAAIMAAKKTPELLPLCHPISLGSVEVTFELRPELGELEITVKVNSVGKTGVEMESLTAAAVAALCVYDMCKTVERGMVIEQIFLERKSGGKSGEWVRSESTSARMERSRKS